MLNGAVKSARLCHIAAMTKLNKAGIVGAGVFGGYHAGKYAAHEAVELAGIYDVDANRAEALAQKFGCESFTDLEAFAKAVDMASVTCPAIYHFGSARLLLQAGVSVLIEKPITHNAAEADDLIKLAQQQKACLAVGHQERLVFEAIGLFNYPERPTHIEAVRMGPKSDRGADVSVSLDLLTHDADLVLTMLGEDAPQSISAKTESHYSGYPDIVEAELLFSQDTRVKLTASRHHHARERWMKIAFPSGEIMINFVTHEFTNTTKFDVNEDFAQTEAGRDSLGMNVNRFIEAVIDPSKSPAISGEAGSHALKLALAIDAAG